MDSNPADAESGTRWEVEYFCDRLCPKLKELDEFKDKDLSTVHRQQEAVLEVLECADETTKSSKFQEFYNGLLHYLNLRDSADINSQSGQFHKEFFVQVVFELYGSDPRSFPNSIVDKLNLPPGLRRTPETKSFLMDLLNRCITRLEATASEKHYYNDIKENLHSILEFFQRAWSRPWGKKTPNFPMTVGFRVLSRRVSNSSWEKAKDYCKERAKMLLQDRARNYECNKPELSGIQIVIGPSGCGKTRYIHSLLQHHWGLYLLAANFLQQNGSEQSEKSSSPSDDLHYGPRRSGASQDTQTWLADVKSFRRYTNFDTWLLANARMRNLLEIRLQVLRLMLKAFNTFNAELTPADWLKLQTSADSSDDLFNQLFRICRFICPSDFSYNPIWKSIGTEVLVCIDEAQCDLQESVLRYSKTIPLLGCMMIEATRHLRMLLHGSGRSPIVISGTALQLERTMEAIRQQLPKLQGQYRSGLYASKVTMSLTTGFKDLQISLKESFPVICSDQDFDELLQQQKWMSSAVQDFVKEIKDNARPLRGRYRWSACYLEEIRRLHATKKLSSEEIQKSCELVISKAKEGLKDRLRDIERRAFVEALAQFKQYSSNSKVVELDFANKEEEKMCETFKRQQRLHTKMLDELCWLAIRSDLLGESTIFESETSAKMVEQGFAFVEERGSTNQTKTTVVVLKERLAVQAAIEYFQEQQSGEEQGSTSKYDQELNKLFYMGQDNQSATGKTAELLFARHLRKVLGHHKQTNDIFSVENLREKRTELLPILVGRGENVGQLVQKDFSQRFDERFNCDPENIHLVEGNCTAYQEETRGDRPDTKTMWNWMRMIREGKDLEYTFWFPSTRAGPDVLFAFRGSTKGLEMNEDILILCAVQIKRQQDPDISDAIQSTNPNHWFCNGFESDRVGILAELQKWQERGYPIVRILITALTNPPQEDESRIKKYLSKEQDMEKNEEQAMTEDQKKERSNLTRRRHIELLKAAKKKEDESKKGKRKRETTPMPPTAAERLEQARRLQHVKIEPDSQYFNWVGAEHDAILFGGAFQRLRESQRWQKEQQSLV